MSENKRYTVKSQDDLFAVVDNLTADKVCIVNGIRTKLEAEWLCDEMNELNDDMEYWKQTACQKENEIQVLTHKLHKKDDMND